MTGAGSGIGEGVARRFSDEGANVVLCDIDLDKVKEVAGMLPSNCTLVISCDVRNFAELQSAVLACVHRFGSLDVMVNNAGIASDGNAADIPLDEWQRTIETNLTGVFNGAKAALPELLKSRGCIVNTASVSGLGADWNMSAYNAAKGGVVNLTRSLALDFGSRGVRTNSVCPSLTRTGMTQEILQNPELVAKFMQRLPLGRVAEPADIAAVVAFLASDDARFVNGVNIPVDGGLMASNGQPSLG